MVNTTTHTGQATEQVRAWDLRPTDTLVDPDTGVAFPITTVTVDEPGRAGREVHVAALVLGARHLPLNQFVTIAKRDNATTGAAPDVEANAAKDRHTLSETACDLIVIEHRLRDVRRWTPETARAHLDAALSSVATALDALHAEYATRTTEQEH
ncbi:hypothetical protein [Nocardioides daphniae]|uniref:Uncharacterized protein n=1 Tax=Nocardioides daphniae TaxID=402297 RepID=A0A4P7UAW0_9ACTN|nr:hypothetical protein [Nocardioides daphniae]QCC76049.1 hypothetical protein E2C04_00490 [Nocardioides daphniae]GGD10749.1 hypothetical protein GCM10007231_06900 [Nocardioides daphniae]